ncbi:MAG: 5'-methylthioadenosine/adenosylhomocysteine nucleosidase [Paenalcaligenes sp.]
MTHSTAIIVAMQEELEIILQHLEHASTHERAGMQFHQGTFAGKPVVAVICGVGKVNAATCTQILISEFAVSRVINIGIAGGIGPGISPGDVVIADCLVQHDMDIAALGLPPGQIFRMDTLYFPTDPTLRRLAQEAASHITAHQVSTGCIASGDQFIACPEKSRWIHQQFNALACEMESASIAQVCYLNNVPVICIRSISDNANDGANMDFEQFMSIAVQNASILLQQMLPACP